MIPCLRTQGGEVDVGLSSRMGFVLRRRWFCGRQLHLVGRMLLGLHVQGQVFF